MPKNFAPAYRQAGWYEKKPLPRFFRISIWQEYSLGKVVYFATQLHRLICIFATMKFLAFILSIYILALNLTPCADYSVPDDEVKIEISQAIGDDHQHQDSDLCSPFCSCQCCHINATHFKIADIELDIKLISTLDFFYLNGSEKDINTSILQPPRV